MKKKCIFIVKECIRNELQISKVTNNDNLSPLECEAMLMSRYTHPMTQRHIPDDSTLQQNHCENLKTKNAVRHAYYKLDSCNRNGIFVQKK